MIPKLDPDRFFRAFETILHVEEGTVVPIRSMAGATIELEDETLTFVDNPILRMVEATRIVFPDRVEGLAASMRLFYLMDVVTKPEVAPLTKMENGQLLIHESLVRAMADIEINEEGTFVMDDLVKSAKENLKAFNLKESVG